MIIVTGGAGFIGSNIVHELNSHGITDILIVDNLSNSAKYKTLKSCKYVDYMDKKYFRRNIIRNGRRKGSHLFSVEAILHQGACTNTLEDDGRYMMDNNFTYSKELLFYAIDMRVPFVYASTAAVYGNSTSFREMPENEKPLNIYGFSKLAFDNYVRRCINIPITVVGLRYFNAYGPNEEHKGRMASTIHQFKKQLKETGKISLFEGCDNVRRDFVYVKDLVRLNMFFAGLGPYESKIRKGIVNAGSGTARSFEDVAHAIDKTAKIEYCPFPDDLKGRYQRFTEADLTELRKLGCELRMTSLEDGVNWSK